MTARTFLSLFLSVALCSSTFAQENNGRNFDNKVAQPKMLPNIVSLAPLQFSENGLGVGFSYERMLDKSNYISFYLPLIATFDLNNGTYTDLNGLRHNGNSDAMFYCMPGIKVYPTGAEGLIKFGIGPSIVIGAGQKSEKVYNGPYGAISGYNVNDHQVVGMIINNSLNINTSTHIYLGLDFGFGITYFSRSAGLNDGTNGLVSGSFKIGYRY